MSKSWDDLTHLFVMQERLMEQLALVHDDFKWPIDISEKSSQVLCRDVTLRATEELHEALQHLKKWKDHKVVDDYEFEHDAFLEEIVDALHYIVELMILVGVKPGNLHDAFEKKHEINMERVSKKIESLKVGGTS